MASGIDRDNADHIPITFVDSGALVAFLVTDPAGPRAPPTPLERAAADYPGCSQTIDFGEFSRISKNPWKSFKIPKIASFESVQGIPLLVAPEAREEPEGWRDRSPGTPQAS